MIGRSTEGIIGITGETSAKGRTTARKTRLALLLLGIEASVAAGADDDRRRGTVDENREGDILRCGLKERWEDKDEEEDEEEER